MLKHFISISKRYYSCEKLKKNDFFLHRSPKIIFNKIFLSHLYSEEESKWSFKDFNGINYIAYHPSMKYTVSIPSDTQLSLNEDVYAIALMPLKNWLVKEKNNVVFFKDSNIAATMTKIVDEETDSILDLYLSANFLSDILTKVRPTGYIVNAINFTNPPILLGELRTENNKKYFYPIHNGFPPVSISSEDKINFLNKTSRKEIFCEMIGWKRGFPAMGHLLSSCPLNFNQHSFLNPITKSPKLQLNLEESVQKLLELYNLKDKPFSKSILNSVINETSEMQINNKEEKSRESFINKCVISIDPIDAKDLDDALHIETLPNGNFEVGVHIADVSHYVRPRSLVDKEAASRASSIYMIHKVIPMLPEILSENLCSLNPDEEKLTFSVVFVVDHSGNIISERFVKGIIKPTMRLNYDEATRIIDGDFQSLSFINHPTFNTVKNSVQKLDKIAKLLRKGRINKGALVLDKVELKFILDENVSPDDRDSVLSLPTSFRVKERGSSNFLIEEWMLLANQAAARLVYNHALSNPTSRSKIGAVLRKHPPPDAKQNYEMAKISQAAGIKIGSISSGKLQQQIVDLKITDPLKSLNLSYICYFNMQLAIYCCAEKALNIDDLKTESLFHHYGLNVPLYTHFTSPIRRYADILVHRQIDAIINKKSSCGSTMALREEAIDNCNAMRPANRRIQERLNALYMAAYLQKTGWKSVKAVILKENKNKMSLLLPNTGIVLWVDLIEFAPWASEVTKSQTIYSVPMALNLKYSVDESKYKIETKHGFTQYVYQWNEKVENIEEEGEQGSSFDEQVEEICQRNTTNNIPKDIVSDNCAIFTVNIFTMIDCILCCSNDKLELLIQMPFPNLLPEIKEDLTRHL